MIEFEFKVEETEQDSPESKKIIEDTYVESEYHALSVAKQNSKEIEALQNTQILLKTQTLLLEYGSQLFMQNKKGKMRNLSKFNMFIRTALIIIYGRNIGRKELRLFLS